MKSIQKLFLTVGGVGYLPLAPGTWGSIVGAAMVMLMCMFVNVHFTASPLFIFAILAVFFLGVFASQALESEWGEDPSQTVIDEVIGVWITLIFVPYTWYAVLIGLILFRVFDIWKPLLIRKMEYTGSGWGVMLDDALAGVYSNIVLHAILAAMHFYNIA